MKNSYEKKRFIFFYWTIAGILLCISAVLIMLLISDADSYHKIILILIGTTIVFMTVLLFLLSMKLISDAYDSVDDISDDMVRFMKNEEYTYNSSEKLYEGSVGYLYANFDKLVCMFRESQQREKKEKEYLKDVMSDISHQLKTPLASMNVFLDLLINDKVDNDEERKEILTESSNQVSRMEWMVLSMLKLARIEAGAIHFNIKKTRLSLILDEVKGGIKYLTDTRGQKLLIECPEDIEINADPEWLTEAIINIVKNASDYSVNELDENENEAIKNEVNENKANENKANENKEKCDRNIIEIKVVQNNIFTRIYIKDHGIGMSEDTMLHIFERFFRASNEVNPNSVGIGLSLSKSIVEGMDGKISVNSVIGEGSTFTIMFPHEN